VFSFREATPADADAVGRAVAEGFEGYREVAPEGWEPPWVPGEVELVTGLMADGQLWCLLAERGGELAGHVAFIPASAGFSPVDDPGLAHFRQLFVEPRWWGSGLAGRLHAAALGEAARRGELP
jgi:predicted N-acetyltransferase YhbS